MTAVTAAATLATGVGVTLAASPANAASSSYGRGWSAVIHHVKAWDDDRATLRMIGPTGRSVTIGEVSDDATIQDVSGDGRQVATVRLSSDGRSHFAFWNTATHRASFLRLPGDWQAAYLSGGRILTWRQSDGLTYVRSSTGKALSSYRITPGAQLMVSPDGTRAVEGLGRSMTVRSALDGRARRTIQSPAKFGCFPMIQWDAASFTAMCQTADELGAERVYRFGYTSSVPTSALAPEGIDQVVATTPRVGAGLSGDGWPPLYTVTATTRKDLRTVPDGGLSGGYGSTIFVTRPAPTGAGETLVKYDSSTRRLTTLDGGAKGGLVTQAQTIDGHN